MAQAPCPGWQQLAPSPLGYGRVRHDPSRLQHFVERLTARLDGEVLSSERLAEFVTWYGRRPAQGFEELKSVLSEQTWRLGTSGASIAVVRILWRSDGSATQRWKATRYGRSAGWLRDWRLRRPPCTESLVASLKARNQAGRGAQADVPVPMEAQALALTGACYERLGLDLGLVGLKRYFGVRIEMATRKALRGEAEELCVFIQGLVREMDGKVLRRGQLMPFTLWYLNAGHAMYVPSPHHRSLLGAEEGLEGLRAALLEQTWILWPQDSDELQVGGGRCIHRAKRHWRFRAQVWKGRVSLRRFFPRRRRSGWRLVWPRQVRSTEQLVKALEAKYVDLEDRCQSLPHVFHAAEEFQSLLLYARRSFQLTVPVLALAVRRLGRLRLWAEALQLLKLPGVQCDTRLFVALADVGRAVGRWDLSLEGLQVARQQGLSPTEPSNAASAAILRCSTAWPVQLELLRSLLRLQLADEISFGTVLAACSRSHHWQLAVRLVHLMQVAQVQPGLVPLCSAAAACSRGERQGWRWSLHWLCLARWNGQVPNLVLQNCALSAVGSWQLAMQKLEDIREARLQPDRVSFSTACAACQRSAAVDPALRLLHELPGQRMQPCALFYSTLVMTCAMGLRWQQGAGLLPHLKASMSTREAFLGSMILARQWQEAAQLLDFGPHRQRLERKSDLAPALQVCRESGSVANARGLIEDVRRRGWRVDAKIQAAAIQSCRRHDRWMEALTLYDQGRQHGLDTSSALFDFLKRMGRWRQALRFGAPGRWCRGMCAPRLVDGSCPCADA